MRIPRAIRPDLIRCAAVAGLGLTVFVLWELVDAVQVGIGFLYAIPIACSGWWYGRVAGLTAAIVCLVVFVATAAGAGVSQLGLATGIRGLAFIAAALLSAQARELSRGRAEATSELRAMRQALTPPQLPEIAGLDVAATLLPAEHEVAGDFYLLTNGPGGWSIAIVGDAAGHGVAAAQIATFTRITVASIAMGTHEPAEILKLANRAVHGQTAGTGKFVTAVCIAFHPDEPIVHWASAGHPLPIALPSPAELEPARYAQPLGLGPELEISANQAPFTAADALVLYTDGLYEVRDADGELGIPRVLSALATATSRTAAEIVTTLRTTLTEFSRRALRDDVCIVVLRRR